MKYAVKLVTHGGGELSCDVIDVEEGATFVQALQAAEVGRTPIADGDSIVIEELDFTEALDEPNVLEWQERDAMPYLGNARPGQVYWIARFEGRQVGLLFELEGWRPNRELFDWLDDRNPLTFGDTQSMVFETAEKAIAEINRLANKEVENAG